MSKLNKTIKIIAKTVAIILIALPAVLTVYFMIMRAYGRLPSVFGYSLSIVVSPSMNELPVGTLVVGKAVDSEQLKVGDIITYKGKIGSYEGKLITHEIIEISAEDDKTVIVTKGTNNQSADPPIDSGDVCAKVIHSFTGLCGVYRCATSSRWTIVPIILLIVSVISLQFYKTCRSYIEEGKNHENKE